MNEKLEMAEVAKSVVVSEPERPEPEEVSLTQLIEKELALRAPSKSHAFTRDFILHEREACNGAAGVNGDTEEWTTVETVALEIQNDADTPKTNGTPEILETGAAGIPETDALVSLVPEYPCPMHDNVSPKSPYENGHVVSSEIETVALDEPQESPPDIQDVPFAQSLENHSVVMTSSETHVVMTSTENHSVIMTSSETPDTTNIKPPDSVLSESWVVVSPSQTSEPVVSPSVTPENIISPPVTSETVVTEPNEPSAFITHELTTTTQEIVSTHDLTNPEIVSTHELTTPEIVSTHEFSAPEIVSSQEFVTSSEDHTETVTTVVTSVVKTIVTSSIDENETESVETTVTERKKKKKSSSLEGGEVLTNGKTKKTKKKKTEEKENHISVKSSFSKFDQLSKKSTVLHVRSSDAAKASKTFSQAETTGTNPSCKACNKTVFAMEQIKAERAVWHKNCFRCHTCNKQLTVDIYSSHEGELYCKPHFKELFQPKAVVETEEPVRRRKPEMIIRESQPIELPPDVVRASDKPDLGLEELSSLNVKSRFQVFEKGDSVDGELERSPTQVSVKRSSSILSKLAKFQKKGMDVGVSDEALNGFVYEGSSSSEEEEDEDEEEEETGVIKCRRKQKERPMSFGKIDDVKKNWECATDQATRREMMREIKKEELQNLRSRLFMGKQGKMKELYEQAVAESEGKSPRKDSEGDIVRSDKAKLVKEKFEKGEVVHSDSDEESRNKKTLNEDMSVFEEGISKKSRSIFLEMDASVAKTASAAPISPVPQKEVKPRLPREAYLSRQASADIVRSSDKVEDVIVETADLSSKFKFFETYKPTEKERKAFRITPPRDGQVKTDSPEREIYRDPMVVRCEDKLEEEQTVLKSQTTSKMLSMFRQLEEQKEVIPDGPKPKKCFTPPPDYRGSESEEESEEEYDEDEDEEEEEEESEGEDGVVKSSYKVKDEFLEQARNAAKARQLAAKFEQWEPEKHSANNAVTMLDSEHASIESTKSLKAKFESLKTEQPSEKSRPKVNRFVEPAAVTRCSTCESKVYPLEKVETDGKTFHRQCFRCSYCNCILRMESYTLNNGQLYCLAHFKQLFITKGNYDEGFGSNQHKRKWETPAN